jgi:hypothetical protein
MTNDYNFLDFFYLYILINLFFINKGMQDSDSMLHNFTTFNNNSSIQCGQRTHISLNQSRTGVNLNSRFSECSVNPDSSSQTRIQSHSSSQGYEGLDNIAIDDFEVCCNYKYIFFLDFLTFLQVANLLQKCLELKLMLFFIFLHKFELHLSL